MSKIGITKTELVWPGKYDNDETLKEVPRVNLPFQIVETINESPATRETKKKLQLTLFDVYEARKAKHLRKAGRISSSGKTTWLVWNLFGKSLQERLT